MTGVYKEGERSPWQVAGDGIDPLASWREEDARQARDLLRKLGQDTGGSREELWARLEVFLRKGRYLK